MSGIGQNHEELNLFTYLRLEPNLRTFSNPAPVILWHISQDDRLLVLLCFVVFLTDLSFVKLAPSSHAHKQISSNSVPVGHWIPKHCPMLFKKQEWFNREMLHSLVTKVTFSKWRLSHAASCSQGHRAPEQSLHRHLLARWRKAGANEN